MKIFRGEDEILLEKVIGRNKRQLSEDEDYIKLGEIRIKDSKYYYKPNLIDQININNNDKSETSSIMESDNLSWLVYKGDKIPFYKKNYRLTEGDIIKLGREWLLIKDIHISNNTRRKINKNKNKQKTNDNNQNIFLSYHSQANQSLNLNGDFNNFEEDNNTDEEKYNDDSDKEDKDKDKENNGLNSTENNNANPIQIFRKDTRKVLENDKDKNEEDNKDKENNNNENNNNKELISSCESEKNSEINQINQKKKICRICFMEEIDKKINPLIKPCKCSGYIKYIHYECLLHWLKTKITINKNIYNNNGFFSIYSLDLIECELCKNHLPDYIKHKNKIYSLLDLDRKFEEEKEKNKAKKSIELKGKGDLSIFNKKMRDNNYIIFDTVTPGKQDNKYRYLVKFDKNNCMKIGRALEMQLILNDISVSRNHCQIRLEEDGNIVLEDNNSKFGSLVLLQTESIEILKGQTLTIQVGTNYLNISLKKPISIFGCCNIDEIDNKHSYEKINSKAIKYDKYNEILNESLTPENSEKEEEEDIKEKNEKQNNSDKNDLIEKEKIKPDIKIWEKKINEHKNKRNGNCDSTYAGSTLFLKDNKNNEDKIKNNESNDKQKEKKENVSIANDDNIIVSESNDNELEEKKEKEEKNDNDNKNLIIEENK